jgi:O-methyltransferase involved in polyketide biosynthesis
MLSPPKATMTENIHPDVSGTAFVVNYSRSRLVNISKDRYAHLWVTPEAISLWEELSQNVYPNDDLNLSLRNRFFLEHIEKFISLHKDCVFISLGAGFDNYPFLIDAECKWVECDLPNIMNYKKNKVEQWIKESKLPCRNIEFLSIDLMNKNQRLGMKERLQTVIGQASSFVLMEGLTYYLKREVLSDIFLILGEIQKPGSRVAFDYWEPDAMAYPAMSKLKNYLDDKFGGSGEDWNLFDATYIDAQKNYITIETVDIAALEWQYSPTRLLQGKDHKIPAHYAVLQRR